MAINGALRWAYFEKGKETCPKYVYLDLPRIGPKISGILKSKWKDKAGASWDSDFTQNTWKAITDRCTFAELLQNKRFPLNGGVIVCPGEKGCKKIIIMDAYTPPDTALGLRWKEVGLEKPQKGREIYNEALAEALRVSHRDQKLEHEFSRKQFADFNLAHLRENSYIKVENRYWRPDKTGINPEGSFQRGSSHFAWSNEPLFSNHLKERDEEAIRDVSGLKWECFKLGSKWTDAGRRDISKNTGVEQLARALTSSSGQAWVEDVGGEPIPGREILNPKLAAALDSKTTFTEEEWDAFGISDLRMDHFVKAESGENYFKPAQETVLAAALGSKFEFTQQEWDAFGIQGLHMHDFLHVDALGLKLYFKPILDVYRHLAFGGLWQANTAEQQEHYKQTEAEFKGLSEAIQGATKEKLNVHVQLINIVHPLDWCSLEADEDKERCELPGCIHKLEDCLELDREEKRELRAELKKAIVQGGCGKEKWFACQNKIKGKPCKNACMKKKYWCCPQKTGQDCADCAPGADSFSYVCCSLSRYLSFIQSS